MNDAEVRIKMLLDSMELRAGAASAKEYLANFAEASESKMHGLRTAIREVKHVLEGFGIAMLIDKAIEFYHVLTDFWIPYIQGTKDSEKANEQWGESVKRSREELRKLDDERAKGKQIEENTALDNASPEKKVEIFTNKLKDLNEQRKKLIKDHGEDAYAWKVVPGVGAMADTEKQAKFAVQKEQIENRIKEAAREVKKAEQEASDAAAKALATQTDADRKAWEAKRDAADKAYEKQERLNKAVAREMETRAQIIAQINQSATDKFLPSENEIMTGGSFEARRMQTDINAEVNKFKKDRLAGAYANNQKGAELEVNHIEEMQKHLSNYLGTNTKTTSEKIAEATAKSAAHLKEIADELKA